MKICELIELLEQYDKNLEVCSGVKSSFGLEHYDLQVFESNPIGDTEAEDEFLIVIGHNQMD